MPLAALRTNNGHYLCALNGGGSGLDASRTWAKEWESFDLLDLNASTLNSGDPVAFRTANGNHITAVDGGGKGVAADKPWVQEFEVFTITRVDKQSGEISDGDAIGLQASNKQYVCAENGGGGKVVANRSALGAWETFTLELKAVEPTSFFAAREDGVTQSGARRMYTEATYFVNDRRLFAKTHTWNSVTLTGFHGGVAVLFLDSNSRAIGSSSVHTFGVDGTWIGQSNRWDTWEEYLDPSTPWLSNVRGIGILHTHAGQNQLSSIVDGALKYGKTIGEVLATLSALAPLL